MATAAAEATLAIIAQGDALKTIEEQGKALMKGLSGILTDADLPHYLLGVPAMFGFVIGEERPTDYRTWAKTNYTLYEEIMMALIHNGAAPDPDGREPWFLCAAHSEKDVADTLNYFEDAVKQVKSL